MTFLNIKIMNKYPGIIIPINHNSDFDLRNDYVNIFGAISSFYLDRGLRFKKLKKDMHFKYRGFDYIFFIFNDGNYNFNNSNYYGNIKFSFREKSHHENTTNLDFPIAYRDYVDRSFKIYFNVLNPDVGRIYSTSNSTNISELLFLSNPSPYAEYEKLITYDHAKKIDPKECSFIDRDEFVSFNDVIDSSFILKMGYVVPDGFIPHYNN